MRITSISIVASVTAGTAFAFAPSTGRYRSFIGTTDKMNDFDSANRLISGVQLGMSKQTPHGGKLVDLMVTGDAEKEAAIAKCTKEIQLTARQLCDVELIVNGGFSPLTGFMDEATYKSVVEDMKLPDDLIFGLPVVYDTDDESLQPGDVALLKDGDRPIATIKFTDKYTPNKPLECLKCYGTSEIEHPGSLMVATERGKYYMGGELTGLNNPVREFVCRTPAEVRDTLPDSADVVAFQCRNPIHRAHYELFTRALDAENVGSDGVVLVHPTCGPTQADDIPGAVRYKTYEVLKEETHNPRTRWEYLPYSMHMAGPREAIQHMMIRKNYGCTHFIIGRDMAGSKSSVTGEDFYGPYDAQDFAKENAPKLNMQTVPSLNLVYTEEEGYVTADEAKERGLHQLKLSGTKFRQMLRAGENIPEWFAFQSVVKVLQENV
jgi:sulfate adenylyltransferase